MSTRGRFRSVATAGITFQAGSAAVDSATIMSALIFQLTGNPILVGAVTAILRFGWLFPQLFVGFLAQRSCASMRYYFIGAFGRAGWMAALAAVLFFGAGLQTHLLAVLVMLIWTAYAFTSGIVAVPYTDIVARSVPSELRSRLLATRFFGGGLLALAVVAIADHVVGTLAFPLSYAAIITVAAALMFLSSVVFSAMGEPQAASDKASRSTFFQYLRDGVTVFRTDLNFRKFVYAQWCGGAVLMAMPFYVVQADSVGVSLENVALLLGAQTAGSLGSNVIWGWWGDRLGKVSLLRVVSIGRTLPPAAILILAPAQFFEPDQMLFLFVGTFFVLGALANGLTIAVIGFLMEISPDDRRPAYTGYFNAITAPSFLLPLLAGIIISMFGLSIIFMISLVAAILQLFFLFRIATREAR